MAESVGIW